jgi:hypothetical protein
MKQLIAFGICLLLAGSSYAQAPKKGAKQVMPLITVLPQKNKAFHKSAIGGYFTDMRKQPVKGVKAYIYGPDSTIIASGFSDAMGYYETNSVKPGMYDLRIIYPGSKFSRTISGVPVMAAKITNISALKEVPPTTDTVIAYADIAPKPVEKPKTGKMAGAKKM